MKENQYFEGYIKDRRKGIFARREQRFRKWCENLNIPIKPFGKLVENITYDDYLPGEHGVPDYQIKLGKPILIEVTGTGSKNINPNSPIWVRPDKLEYAKRHKDQECWLCHILDGIDPPIMRFMMISNIDMSDYETNEVRFRGNVEHYKVIPAPLFIYEDDFLNYLIDDFI